MTNKSVQFFGKITASFTHELKNVIATINEYSGLLGDLLSVSGGAQAIDPLKLKLISQKIDGQIKRGEELIQRLNRFSHTVDVEKNTIEVNQTLQDIIGLSTRFAFLKQVKLKSIFLKEELPFNTNPFIFQHLIFLCIIRALGLAEKNTEVTLAVEKTDCGCNIIIKNESIKEYSDDSQSELVLIQKLEGEINSNLKVITEDDNKQVKIFIS